MTKKFVLLFLWLIVVLELQCENKNSLKKENYILKNCNIIVGDGNIIYDHDIEIENESIKEIRKPSIYNTNIKTIDLKGKIVLPGFINTHVHKAYDREQLERWLRAGVTTVRDMFALNPEQLLIRDKLNKSNMNARLISASGMLSPVGGYGNEKIRSLDHAKNVINEYHSKKVDVIKIAIEDNLAGSDFKIFDMDEIKNIVDLSHSKNLWVTAHISHVRNLKFAIEGNVDELAHMIMENLEDELIDEIIEKDIYIVPTLELWNVVSNLYNFRLNKNVIKNLNNFYKKGGKIAFGTDYAGFYGEFDKDFPISEVKLMEEAGMSIMDIIIAGTRNSSIVVGKRNEIGTIESGKIADLLILNKNPLENSNNFLDQYMVIHNGEIIKRTK